MWVEAEVAGVLDLEEVERLVRTSRTGDVRRSGMVTRTVTLGRRRVPVKRVPAPGLKLLLRDVKNPHCPDERAAAEDRALSKLMRLTRP